MIGNEIAVKKREVVDYQNARSLNVHQLFPLETDERGDHDDQAVTVDVTNSNGCTATSAPVSVTVSPVPSGTLTSTPSTTASTATICFGDNITFTATNSFKMQEIIGRKEAEASGDFFEAGFAGPGSGNRRDCGLS